MYKLTDKKKVVFLLKKIAYLTYQIQLMFWCALIRAYAIIMVDMVISFQANISDLCRIYHPNYFFAYQEILNAFLSSDFSSKINFFEKFFQEYHQSVKQLGSSSGQTFCRT